VVAAPDPEIAAANEEVWEIEGDGTNSVINRDSNLSLVADA
jgi:hypothetical protein